MAIFNEEYLQGITINDCLEEEVMSLDEAFDVLESYLTEERASMRTAAGQKTASVIDSMSNKLNNNFIVKKMPTSVMKHLYASEVKGFHSGKAAKQADKVIDLEKKVYSKYGYPNLTDNQTNAAKELTKSGTKRLIGKTYGSELAKRGVDVKTLSAKAAAKGDAKAKRVEAPQKVAGNAAANKEIIKANLKAKGKLAEACYTILEALGEFDD